MASSSSLPLLLLLSLLLLTSTFFHLSASFLLLLPITKHAPTNQHLTQIHVGTRPDPVSLLVDLSSRFLWLDCASASVSGSLTQTPIPCLSIRCSTASSSCAANLNASSSPHPHLPPCVLHPTNPVSKSVGRGELVEGTVSVRFQPASTETVAAAVEVENFLLTCAPNSLLGGLAGGVRGVFGLGKSSRISPTSQIAHKLDLPRKFFLCLPGGRSGASYGGMIFAGGNVPDRVSDISRSMVYTPFLTLGEESKSKFGTSSSSDDYSFRVKSVEVDGRKLSLPVTQIRARISSTEPFTRVGSGIYRALVRGFTAAAAESESLNLRMVEGGGSNDGFGFGFGFEVCYRIGGVGGGGSGAVEEKVPAIDLVLQSEMVKWRIDGYNSMVRVGGEEEGVVCLGMVDGGSDLEEDEMVIGAYQIEDNLLEFDLVSGMLGISSTSLLSKGTSCSELSLGAHAAHQSL